MQLRARPQLSILFFVLLAGCLTLHSGCQEVQSEAAPARERARGLRPFQVVQSGARAFLDAYPEWFDRFEGRSLVWKDGSRTTWQRSLTPRQFHQLMRIGRLHLGPIYRKMYGDSKSDASEQLTTVIWLPGSKKQKIKFAKTNGAAEALQRVSNALDSLKHLHKYLTPIGGTFNWRNIAGSKSQSVHSYGIAIDINTKYADYWRWSPEFKAGKRLKYRNRIPEELVAVFEREGFVWGGRWPHYDTMHFEYRPEVKLYNAAIDSIVAGF